jgi:RNA polymerase sigma factor (sigma-70 family)
MRQDQSLLRACQNGDRKAWQTMLDRYERLVYSIPLNFGLSHSDADDVAQATFSALIRGLDSITDEDRLGAWLGTVARRQTWRLVERRRREPPVSDDRLDRVSTEDSVTDLTANLEWVHQGMAKMDARCRDLLTVLYFSEDAPAYAAVADEFGIPVGSIGPTRARCLDKLRSFLEQLQVE